MSFYSLVFGKNPAADAILATLGLTRADVGRFRDCFVAGGEIAVYTRNGGGNREDYQEVIDRLAGHANYLRDQDDDFDSTYATFYFSFPAEYAEDLKALDSGEAFEPSKRWTDMLALLGAPVEKGEP